MNVKVLNNINMHCYRVLGWQLTVTILKRISQQEKYLNDVCQGKKLKMQSSNIRNRVNARKNPRQCFSMVRSSSKQNSISVDIKASTWLH